MIRGMLQHVQDREVTLDQRLEKPILFEGTRLRGTDVRKVGVKNQGESAFGQGTTRKVAESKTSFPLRTVSH